VLTARLLVLFALPAFAATLLCLGQSGSAAGAADLELSLSAEPSDGSGSLVAQAAALVVAVVTNKGSDAAGTFEVDLWANDSKGQIVLPPHTLTVPALPAGGNLTLRDSETFVLALSGDLRIFGIADPAGRVNESALSNNHVNVTVYFGPPTATRVVEDIAVRASGNRMLPPYTLLAMRVDLREGDSLIFQADAEAPGTFDCYLLNDANFTIYFNAREAPANHSQVTFLQDYSRTDTDHIAFTSEPLPPGRYYLVLENDDRLQRGASPIGPVNLSFAVAIVNNSLPPGAIALVIGAAAAAIWATVRWRPHFDVRSPLLEVPPPDPDELAEEREGAGALGQELEEGEGLPPHPP